MSKNSPYISWRSSGITGGHARGDRMARVHRPDELAVVRLAPAEAARGAHQAPKRLRVVRRSAARRGPSRPAPVAARAAELVGHLVVARCPHQTSTSVVVERAAEAVVGLVQRRGRDVRRPPSVLADRRRRSPRACRRDRRPHVVVVRSCTFSPQTVTRIGRSALTTRSSDGGGAWSAGSPRVGRLRRRARFARRCVSSACPG